MELRRDRVNERPLVDHGTNHDVAVDSIGRVAHAPVGPHLLQSPIAEMVMG